jgi:hypothetical protein
VLGKKRRLARDYWTLFSIHYFERKTLRLLSIELQSVGSFDFFNRKKRAMINLVEERDMEFSFRITHRPYLINGLYSSLRIMRLASYLIMGRSQLGGNAMTLIRPFLCIAAAALVACSNSNSPGGELRTGMWGGPRVGLSVEPTRVTLLFDCAAGTVESPISAAGDGRFDVTGTFINGGNARGVDHTPRAARYFGRISGTHVAFTRVLLDGSMPDASFSAQFGAAPEIVAC